MTNFLYDFIPVLLFFIAFKLYGIYTAVMVGMVATAVQFIFTLCFKRKWDKQQFITLIIFVVFGSMTLYFHNPIFIKWKPTIIFWLFASVLIISHFVGKKPIMQQMLQSILENSNTVPEKAWRVINIFWAIFFILLGTINLIFVYYYSTAAWVNFKFYGITGAVLLFSILQSCYLVKYLSIAEKKNES